jgi:hypothetical protein
MTLMKIQQCKFLPGKRVGKWLLIYQFQQDQIPSQQWSELVINWIYSALSSKCWYEQVHCDSVEGLSKNKNLLRAF